MYSRKSWGGPVQPHIEMKFVAQPDAVDDPVASLIIFEWKDYDLVGVYPTLDSVEVRV